jgi:HEPN domain-containing protein
MKPVYEDGEEYIPDAGDWDNACYHCQQSVEKALKGYLVSHDIEPIKTHDCQMLCVLCAGYEPEFLQFATVCNGMSKYVERTRYPDPNNLNITEDETLQVIENTKRIVAFCKQKVKDENPAEADKIE